MTRIFIENSELDIDKGLSNQITYAIDDLNNLDSKTTAFSKTIVIPGTTKNNNLLGNIFDFNNSNFTDDALPNVKYNFNASRSAKCRIDVNGLQVIKGVFRLLEIVYNSGQVEYECAVFGELGGFIAKVGNLRLEDMNFSGYDQYYAVSGITASWNNSNAGQGVVFPLIDYGTYSTGAYGTLKKDYQYNTFRPAMFVREYMDKIITGAGYTWESNFFNTDFFKRLIIPNNRKDLLIPKSQLFYTGGNPVYNVEDTFIAGDATLVVQGDVTIPSFTGALFTTSDNKEFTYTGSAASVSMAIVLNGSISLFADTPPAAGDERTMSVRIDVYKNGILAYSNGLTYGLGALGSTTFVYNETAQLSFVTSDTFKIHVTTTITKFPPMGTVNYLVDINGSSVTIDSPVPVLSPAALGDFIRINEILPKNIFQKDFFASILKMFYLMVTEDKNQEKHLVIEPWVNFFSLDRSTYIDWSNKVDRSKQIRVKPMSEINSRYYELKYKQDNDFYNEGYLKKYNEGYGDRVFDNGFEFAKEKETVEVIFSPTVLVGYDNEDKITSAIFKRNNALEDRMDSNIRIMQAKKVTGVASWDIMSAASVLSSNTVYQYAGHLDDPDAPNADINFGVPKELFFTLVSGNLSNNLFNTYYSSYMAEITDKDSRLLQCMVKLSEVDIYNLDFSKFIFIDGGLYRINKLIDYTAGENEPTKAELLRVIYSTY